MPNMFECILTMVVCRCKWFSPQGCATSLLLAFKKPNGWFVHYRIAPGVRTTSASAYADDMLVAALSALSATDLAQPAEKIEASVNWLGMAVNDRKCAVTGILWDQARRNGSDKVLSSQMMKMLQQSLECTKHSYFILAPLH